ncbi:hypothetical protein [Spartinivicinus poritis]|uniref:Uncharacterized protein n=1 Tax=Spartinivicinus poritis TaxID=2994640 RepID=A0ABT5UJV1_9GAMM|nr:hypothetical protein [Spartinivicinus sp. A2-2]MDE1465792.1 hypothetical protein [Spartinivicinus sp. A2-2]
MKSCFIILISLLSTYSFAQPKDETKVTIDANSITYQGYLSAEANEKVYKLFNQAKIKPSWFTIKSKGGNVSLGLDLAEWIYKNRLNVKVVDYCFSSCANYILPAGKQLVLEKTAIFGYHGSANSKDNDIDKNFSDLDEYINTLPEKDRIPTKEKILKQFQADLTRDRKREVNLYKKLGISPQLPLLGQQEKYQQSLKNYLGTDNLEEKDQYKGWYYSLSDLKSLGVTNITVIDPPWTPAENIKEFKLLRLDIVKGELRP